MSSLREFFLLDDKKLFCTSSFLFRLLHNLEPIMVNSRVDNTTYSTAKSTSSQDKIRRVIQKWEWILLGILNCYFQSVNFTFNTNHNTTITKDSITFVYQNVVGPSNFFNQIKFKKFLTSFCKKSIFLLEPFLYPLITKST